MRLTADDMVLLPDLVRYLRDSMPQCADNSKIVNQLVKFGNLTVSEARHALLWETDPLVTADLLSNHRCAGHVTAAFHAANIIEISMAAYNEFANGRGLSHNAAGVNVPIIGVALLHQLCHWGNFRHAVKEKKEEGFAFELATYGRMIS